MIDPTLHKDILLKLLNLFVAVCEKNGLHYYLAGGSVLGAVRHQGLIPWDDDIDVFMPRKDYELLQGLPDDVFGSGFRLASWRKNKNYTYDFLKLEALNTTLLERFHPDYLGGVFLDIFPVDYFPSTKTNIRRIEKYVTAFQDRIVECLLKNDSECENVFELLLLRIKRVCYNPIKSVDKFEEFLISLGGEGDMMADFHNYTHSHGGWPASYFGKGIQMQFEGKPYIVPENWDAYLTHMYGDYMTPPPPGKRYGHRFEYVNYERRLSDAEVREEWKKIHAKYAYRFSFKRELKSLLKKFHLR